MKKIIKRTIASENELNKLGFYFPSQCKECGSDELTFENVYRYNMKRRKQIEGKCKECKKIIHVKRNGEIKDKKLPTNIKRWKEEKRIGYYVQLNRRKDGKRYFVGGKLFRYNENNLNEEQASSFIQAIKYRDKLEHLFPVNILNDLCPYDDKKDINSWIKTRVKDNLEEIKR